MPYFGYYLLVGEYVQWRTLEGERRVDLLTLKYDYGDEDCILGWWLQSTNAVIGRDQTWEHNWSRKPALLAKE